ncbi:hypothetical protein ACFO0N_14975 [Halobium salinum]|uniref:Uncharacterized protein n=1 Tax=Halobium salinum TaxID=1364940 RepID=A0ABD5PF07_9EURY|nr:hypothetical protein [Halobium salinum]
MSPVPKLEVEDANTTGWKNLVSTNGPGVLKGIGVTHAYAAVPVVRIKIDGNIDQKGEIGSGWGSNYGNVGMSLGLPFNDNLQIEIKNRNSKNPVTKFWASVVLGQHP